MAIFGKTCTKIFQNFEVMQRRTKQALWGLRLVYHYRYSITLFKKHARVPLIASKMYQLTLKFWVKNLSPQNFSLLSTATIHSDPIPAIHSLFSYFRNFYVSLLVALIILFLSSFLFSATVEYCFNDFSFQSTDFASRSTSSLFIHSFMIIKISPTLLQLAQYLFAYNNPSVLFL